MMLVIILMGSGKDLKLHMNTILARTHYKTVQDMQHGRWYPYCIVLEDGKVLTIGGWDEWGCKNALAEIYDPDSKSWSIKYDLHNQAVTLLTA